MEIDKEESTITITVLNGMRCQFCQVAFASMNRLVKHSNKLHHDLIANQWLSCSSCSLLYPSLTSLKAHVASSHLRQTRKLESEVHKVEKLKCQFCVETFRKNESLFKHCNTVHTDLVIEQWLICEVCKLYYPTANSLKSHMASAHTKKNGNNEQKFNDCQFCQKKFKEKKYYHVHANQQHLNEISAIWHACQVCGTFRPDEESVSWHKKAAHANELVKVGSHICQFCSTVFSQAYTYYKHANVKHREDISKDWLSCGTCSNFYPSQEVLEAHKSTAHYTAKDLSHKTLCSFCPSTFTSTNQYYRHCNSKHQNDIQNKWLACVQCQLMLPTSQSLQNHFISSHSERIASEASIQCSFCIRKFTRPSRYWQHANDVHPEEVAQDWFVCETCDTYYPSHGSLKNHSNAHKDVKKRSCEFCHSTHYSNTIYYKHVNLNHKSEASSTWVTCKYCSYLLPDTLSLKNHCGSVHTVMTAIGQTIKCRYCKLTVNSKSDFYSHANKTHYNIVATKWKKCNKCKLFLPNLSSLRDHKVRSCASMLKLKSGTQECQFCLKSFSKTWQYYKHVNKEHKDAAAGTWLLCQECVKFYPSEDALNSHIASTHAKIESQVAIKHDTVVGCEKMDTAKDIVTGEEMPKKKNLTEKIQCSECPRIYARIWDYYSHMNKQHLESVKETWLKCPECTKYFPNDKSLKNHITGSHTKVVVNNVLPKPNFDIDNGNLMKCPECQTLFKHVSSLFKHSAHLHYWNEMASLYQSHFLVSDGTCSVCPTKVNVESLNKYVLHMGGRHRLITKFMTPEIAEKYSRFPTTVPEYEEFQSIQKLFGRTEINLIKKVKETERIGTRVVRTKICHQTKERLEEPMQAIDMTTEHQKKENPVMTLSKQDSENSSSGFKCPECQETFRIISCLYIHSARSHYYKQLAERYRSQFMLTEGKCSLCPNRSIDDVKYYIRHMGGKHRIIHQLMSSEMLLKYNVFPVKENNSNASPSKKPSSICCLLCEPTEKRKEFSNITVYKQHLAINHFRKQISELHMQTLPRSDSGQLLCYICENQQGNVQRHHFKTHNSLVVHLGSKHNFILDFASEDLKSQLNELGVVKHHDVITKS